ncbi:MAG: ABC transporter permease [Acidobacteriaceae bacterium]
MTWLYTLRLRWLSLFRREQIDQEIDDELRDHVEQQIAASLAAGMSPEQAHTQALRAIGGITQVKEQCAEAHRFNATENFAQDLRFGFRQLLRNPGFSALAIFCLILGIGANASVFSWLEGILFRPYPAVVHQERLVALAGTSRGETGPTEISWPDFQALRQNCTQCDSLFVSKITSSTLNIGARAEATIGSIVSANYFEAIGVRPALGRAFEAGDDTGSNAHPVVVISDQLWHRRFHADPNIIGKVQRLNDVPHTIIGVAPPGFYGTFVGWAMQFWVPASMEETFETGGYKLEDHSARWAEAYVRLKPGVTRAQAQQEVSAVAARLAADYPATNRGRSLRLWPLWQTPFNNAGTLLPTLEIMIVVVAFVLLIACANVANLLLVRSLGRRHEMALRLAIGASRVRLLRQLLTEALLLAVIGAAGGLLVALLCRHALVLLLPTRSGIAMFLPGQVDWRVMLVNGAICLLVTLIVGLVPALQARDIEIAGALRSESPSVVGTRGKAWMRSGMVILQVCLSFILLVGAALLLESLHRIRTTSPGFSTTSVVQTGASLVAAGYDAPRARDFQDNLIDRVRDLPGVDSAAFARLSPLGYGSYSSTPIAVDGYDVPLEDQPTVEYNQVSPGYFATLGIPLISGREFTRNDKENAPLVAIVNRTMATRFWHGQDPIGRRVKIKAGWARVVAVAADSKVESMREDPTPFFYVPLRQDFVLAPIFYLRTTQPLPAVAAALLEQVHALDANVGLYELITLQQQVDRSTSPQLVAVTLVALLSSLAVILAAVGLYGVISWSVAQSTRELGLRMALGAGAPRLLRMVIARGLRLTAAGILLGAAGGFALTRLLGNILFNVSPHDFTAFASALLTMTIIAIAACLLPAWRATRVDPTQVLRS